MAVATWKGRLEAMEVLLENGADACAMNTNRENQQPIHIAAMKGDMDAIKLLLRHSASLDSATYSYGPTTPVELAIRYF